MIIPNIWKNKKCSKPPTSVWTLGGGFDKNYHTELLLIKMRLKRQTNMGAQHHSLSQNRAVKSSLHCSRFCFVEQFPLIKKGPQHQAYRWIDECGGDSPPFSWFSHGFPIWFSHFPTVFWWFFCWIHHESLGSWSWELQPVWHLYLRISWTHTGWW